MLNTSSTPGQPAATAACGAPAVPAASAVGEVELVELVSCVRQAEALLARAVGLAGRLAGSGVCERAEGLPLEVLLGLAARMTGADRRMLVTAGETLAGMPDTGRLFQEGAISWGQVRGIVAAARRLTVAQRGLLDARIAATAARHGGIDALDPDQLLWGVDAAVDELRDPKHVERAEARGRDANFLAVQASFEGRVRLYGDYDPLTAAGILNALDTAAGRPQPAHDASADPAGDMPLERVGLVSGQPTGSWTPTGRAGQYAWALEGICAEYLGGGAGRAARPLLVAHVDLAQATAASGGTIELNVRGPLPRVTAKTLESLVASADVRAVLFDGAHPLAVGKRVHAEGVPAVTRFAVRARDRGCRFPGSADPIGHTDVHHLVHREDGGDHHPANLAALSRRYHTLAHRHGWQLSLQPVSGQLHARRGNRTWRSLPRGTPLAPAPGRGKDPPGTGPPDPDPDFPF